MTPPGNNWAPIRFTLIREERTLTEVENTESVVNCRFNHRGSCFPCKLRSGYDLITNPFGEPCHQTTSCRVLASPGPRQAQLYLSQPRPPQSIRMTCWKDLRMLSWDHDTELGVVGCWEGLATFKAWTQELINPRGFVEFDLWHQASGGIRSDIHRKPISLKKPLFARSKFCGGEPVNTAILGVYSPWCVSIVTKARQHKVAMYPPTSTFPETAGDVSIVSVDW